MLVICNIIYCRLNLSDQFWKTVIIISLKAVCSRFARAGGAKHVSTFAVGV